MSQERALFRLPPEFDNASYEVRSREWLVTERARQAHRDDPFAVIPEKYLARFTKP